jgi:hypothetical protein
LDFVERGKHGQISVENGTKTSPAGWRIDRRPRDPGWKRAAVMTRDFPSFNSHFTPLKQRATPARLQQSKQWTTWSQNASSRWFS